MTNLGNGNSLSVNLSANKKITGNLSKDNHLTSRLSIIIDLIAIQLILQ